MQRQRRKGDENGANTASSSSSRPAAPARTNSKTSKRQRGRFLVLFVLGLPILLGCLLLYSTRSLASHETPSRQSTALMGGTDIRNDALTTSGGFEYHIVFSTGCSLYQDWQSYVFFYQAMVTKQPGTVTRIVSGCEDDEEKQMRALFQDQIAPMSKNFKIHFTPDYSRLKGDGSKFVYFNKPFGMRHWLENALGFPENPANPDAIVILMDPDQLILRPFENNDFSNTQWKFLKKDQAPYTRIEHGKPMGQLYGFGLQWRYKVNITKIVANSPIETLSTLDAQAGYIVGPPYVATAKDMYTIVKQWCDFALPVHEQYPFLLAEMFAYCLAAAHLQLPHQTALSFMISDTAAGKMEGWSYIDNMPDEEVCGGFQPEEVPNVLHFCQRYGQGHYFFGKRKLPKDFLSCESPLLEEPPHDLLTRYEYAMFPDDNRKDWKPDVRKRNVFVLCSMIPALNAAAEYYKRQHCDGSANFEKSLTFIPPLKEETSSTA